MFNSSLDEAPLLSFISPVSPQQLTITGFGATLLGACTSEGVSHVSGTPRKLGPPVRDAGG